MGAQCSSTSVPAGKMAPALDRCQAITIPSNAGDYTLNAGQSASNPFVITDKAACQICAAKLVNIGGLPVKLTPTQLETALAASLTNAFSNGAAPYVSTCTYMTTAADGMTGTNIQLTIGPASELGVTC